MELILWFASLVNGQVPLLGHDQFEVRERAESRLNNPLAALFLPDSDPDPEVNHRLRGLKTRNLKWLKPRYVEQVVYRHDFNEWARLYLFTGRSRVAREVDTFSDIHSDQAKADAVFREWRAWGWPMPGEGFLRGSFQPGEYETWLEFLDFHLSVAPAPREVVPDPNP